MVTMLLVSQRVYALQIRIPQIDAEVLIYIYLLLEYTFKLQCHGGDIYLIYASESPDGSSICQYMSYRLQMYTQVPSTLPEVAMYIQIIVSTSANGLL